jgi:hypothetical protein
MKTLDSYMPASLATIDITIIQRLEDDGALHSTHTTKEVVLFNFDKNLLSTSVLTSWSFSFSLVPSLRCR